MESRAAPRKFLTRRAAVGFRERLPSRVESALCGRSL
jgi:hypothetical protein